MTYWRAYQTFRHSENLENFCECNEQINFLVIQNLFQIIGKGVHKNIKKRAFALAEVLITLGIIGVVAAMSIPTLLNFYNRKMLEVRFKKTDAVLIQAMKMASEELGVDSFEVYSNVPKDEREATMDLFNSIWEKQFKGATKYYIKDIGKYIGNDRDPRSWGRLGIYSFQNGTAFSGNYYGSMIDNKRKAYALILPDGSMISSPQIVGSFTNTSAKIVFDTNGPWAGPNRLGYDVFNYFSNPYYFANNCSPIGGDTYSSRGDGCYKHAHLNQNPYDKSIGWWSSLYKDKSWWENLKSKNDK